MNCTLCQSILTKKIDKYYYICQNCNAYVKDVQYYITSDQERNRYEEHNNDVSDIRYQNFTSPITNKILRDYNKNHLGLDYGCGTGPVISEQLLQNGFKVKLYDPFFYPDNDYLNYKYDYIFSCEVFEHFHKPKYEIEKIISLLQSNGRLLIMTHLYQESIEFENWYYRNDPTHVFIYTKKTFEFIANKYNIQIEKLNERFVVLAKGF